LSVNIHHLRILAAMIRWFHTPVCGVLLRIGDNKT